MTTKLPISPIPRRTLRKTGCQVTIYGLGGLFTVSMHDRDEQAAEIVNRRSIWASTTSTPRPCTAMVPVN